ncbi:major facilitator superfamily transporter [Drepanopeziza brunnea f. sp. 'multigermtubi' MB_m1]|uniref:Major facilitator superfamily transporter n=1 Tax=Marssonina brunnea f. sp. multigermtubi (strain MB_m1) TaxID=1072389 RepID=K1WIF0_MARBU|nr:major facilitator superfamily transporter [Drepanopeziza brunnea f. sp. 'multigermtubi' MB_m1]EKD11977.1 major facilitator superfamily transporter [Drepanopeziza brunnea f. sp. 'multigermtubi' MB_m1]
MSATNFTSYVLLGRNHHLHGLHGERQPILCLSLGLSEYGMFYCLSPYLSTFYNREEQALWMAYLSAEPLSPAPGGSLFAFALLKMDGISSLEGWRWLFILEGVTTVAVAILVYFLLPDNFESTRFLSEPHKELMRTRVETIRRYNGHPADIYSSGLSNFLPLIIKSFGYGSLTTQLLASGYALQIGVPFQARSALYFSTFPIEPCIYCIHRLNATWLMNSHAGYCKRATAIRLNQPVGNRAGLVVEHTFKKRPHSKYTLELCFSVGRGVYIWLL